jgi:glycosyltransferase involved in cell wall biosynthesis
VKSKPTVLLLCVAASEQTDGYSKRADDVQNALGKSFVVLRISHLFIKKSVLSVARLPRSIALARPDAVYCVNDMFGFLLVYSFSRLFRIKLIFEAHAVEHLQRAQVSTLTGGLGSLVYKLLEYAVGKGADSIVALSMPAYRFFKRVNPGTAYVPVFVDRTRFNRPHSKGGRTRKRIGLIGPFDTFFNADQLEFLKRHLNEMDDRIHFVAIGRTSVKIREDRIAYLGYLRSEKAYAESVNDLDALLVPVRIGTLGPKNKILEAMACSVPVFTTPQGILGMSFVQPGVNVFVFDEDELPGKINELVFDDIAMEKVGEKAMETVKRHYDAAVWVEALNIAMKETFQS